MTVFLVTGVTGNLGSAALRSLLQRVPASQVRVLVRTDRAAAQFVAQGLTACVADYSDSASLDAAFTGVDRSIFVSRADQPRNRGELWGSRREHGHEYRTNNRQR
ncbi:NAD-dependent epimerase/dehydratase family protein [Cryobacterium algoricola]|uniref:NAD-dependent epimerase/dehydratase family protein n=1 Tax=Cryobacterium algoricola TaxID=1259183 RepID=A0ABY2IEZ4_9MICO|nr:NAD-dependent epimerase/dehydratase family protein [Cryobacterium algoricola]